MLNKPQLPPGEFLLQFARDVLAEYDKPERARVQTSVTLRRRLRGIGKSDLLGRFSAETGNWLGDGPERERLMDMYSFQVVKTIIRANQAAMVQARVQIDASPASKSRAELDGVAAIANGIIRYANNHPDYWSNNLENAMAQQGQTDYGFYTHVYHDPDAKSPVNLQIDEYSDEPVEQAGEYACEHCGKEGPFFTEQSGQASEDLMTMPCLHCGEMAEIISMPEMPDVPQFKGKSEHPAGNTVLDLVSFYQIRIDERKSKNGNLRKAEWMEHHFLMDEDDLQAKVPYFDIKAPMEWSYPLKWEHCLETGNDRYLKPWSADMSSGMNMQHEVRRIYMRPSKYRHYRSPCDFTLDRGDGQAAMDREGSKPMLSIKQGEGFIDAYPDGFWFVVSNDQLLPWMEACDFHEEWAVAGYLNDSASFHYQPATELNELARAADNLWTIEVQHLESSSIANTVYDRDWFDGDAFEEQLTPTREGKYIAPGDDIRRHFTMVTPPQMTGAMEGIGFVRSIIGDIGGPQPATLGRVQPGVAYASQALQREQSLGLLNPYSQAKAECKAQVMLQMMKQSQRTRPIEWFQYIASMYGEEWKGQDIQAFLEADLDLDLIVKYKEGSEKPASLIQRSLEYRQYIMDVAEVAKSTGNANLVKPEMLADYGEMVGVDYDLENTEADRRLADVRYRKIREWVEAQGQEIFNLSEDQEKALVQIALADRSLKVMPRENHQVAIEFYADHARALIADEYPNFVLISCLLEMIKRHEDGGVDQKQTDTANEIEGQAPALAAQAAAAQMQGQGAAAAEKAKADAQAEANKAKIEAEERKAAAQRQHDAEQAAADREHEAQKTEAELALKSAKQAADHSANEPSTAQKVSESISYKDAAPSIRRQMEAQAGMTPATGDEHKLEKATLAQEAKPKPAPRPSA